MEEAELLCDRISILVNGIFQCGGSPNHLKMKFNETYVLEINSNDMNLLNNSLRNDIPLFSDDHHVRY